MLFRSDPSRKDIGAADSRRKEKDANSRRSKNNRLFPNMAAIVVGKIMRFVENNEIGPNVFTVSERIKKLVAVDLGSPDYQRSFGVLFSVACKDADIASIKLFAKFDVFRVRQGLERRRIPDPLILGEQAADLFAGDPCFTAAVGAVTRTS